MFYLITISLSDSSFQDGPVKISECILNSFYMDFDKNHIPHT